MPRLSLALLAFLLLGLDVAAALAQRPGRYRDARAYLELAAGDWVYYGPIDLRASADFPGNYLDDPDPAAVFMLTFPLQTGRWYFRGQVGLTNFDTENERALLQQTAGTDVGVNEFLRHDLLWFEPQVLYNLRDGQRHRWVPYVYSGFGGLIANPFQESHDPVGAPGPNRSVFTLPLGVGLDWYVSRHLSLFADYSFRFNLNYVGRNEEDFNPFNTTLLMGGIRIALFRRNVEYVADDPAPLPPPVEVSPYRPPIAEPVSICTLSELNAVFFAYNDSALDPAMRNDLRENVEALGLNPACCVNVVGYTDTETGVEAVRMSRQRAASVYEYYLELGLPAARMRVEAGGIGLPPCDKKENDGPGCDRNRRVDTNPFDCDALMDR